MAGVTKKLYYVLWVTLARL